MQSFILILLLTSLCFCKDSSPSSDNSNQQCHSSPNTILPRNTSRNVFDCVADEKSFYSEKVVSPENEKKSIETKPVRENKRMNEHSLLLQVRNSAISTSIELIVGFSCLALLGMAIKGVKSIFH